MVKGKKYKHIVGKAKNIQDEKCIQDHQSDHFQTKGCVCVFTTEGQTTTPQTVATLCPSHDITHLPGQFGQNL